MAATSPQPSESLLDVSSLKELGKKGLVDALNSVRKLSFVGTSRLE